MFVHSYEIFRKKKFIFVYYFISFVDCDKQKNQTTEITAVWSNI
jgi:hypothetical protein